MQTLLLMGLGAEMTFDPFQRGIEKRVNWPFSI